MISKVRVTAHSKCVSELESLINFIFTFQVFIPLTLLAVVNAGLLPYEAPVQPVQHIPVEHIPVEHAPVHVQHVPVEHVPVQPVPVHVQPVHIPQPTQQIVSIQKTIVKEVAVRIVLKKHIILKNISTNSNDYIFFFQI